MNESQSLTTLPIPGIQWLTILKFIFNFKFIAIVIILGLSASTYLLKQKVDILSDKNQLLNEQLATSDSSLKICTQLNDGLKQSIKDAQEQNKRIEETIFNLNTSIEKFNRNDRNNSQKIEQLRMQALASSCEDSILELIKD